MTTLAERLYGLRERLGATGVDPVPWDTVTSRAAALRSVPAEVWATAGTALDGSLAAAEDEWPTEITAYLERLGWADRWDPRALTFLLAPVDEDSVVELREAVRGTDLEEETVTAVEAGPADLPAGADGIATVVDSLDTASLVREWLPSTGLGVVTLRALRAQRDGASFEEVRDRLAEEGVTLVAAHVAGLAVETATGVVVLRPLTSAAVRVARARHLAQRDARARLADQRSLATALAQRAGRRSDRYPAVR